MPGALCHVGSEGDIKHYENAKGLRNLQSSFFVLYSMAIRVVEFSNGGYKIRKIFA